MSSTLRVDIIETLDGTFNHSVKGLSVTVDTVAALRATSQLALSTVDTRGYSAIGDGGDGTYWADASDTTSADNGVTIIVNAAGTRFKLKHGGVLRSKQTGAKGDGITVDRLRLQAGVDAAEALGIKSFIFDPGTYVLDQSLLISDKIKYGGKATIQASQLVYNGVMVAPFSSIGAQFTLPLFRNKNFFASTITDRDIVIEDLSFDFGSLTVVGGGLHHINIRRASNCRIQGCTFYKGENGTSFLACQSTFVEKCTAYDFTNCAYDHWDSPNDASVIDCKAYSANSVQMVNFNPEPTADYTTTGLAATGFTVTGCEFTYTGATGGFIQIEPLTNGNSVAHVTFTGNVLRNISLVIRRNTSIVSATGNTFIGGVATNDHAAIMCNALDGSVSPSTITVSGNTFADWYTSAGNNAVITVLANGYTIDGNTVAGANHYSAVSVGAFTGRIGVNYLTPGTSGQPILGSGGYSPWVGVSAFSGGWQNFGAPLPGLAYMVTHDGFIELRGTVKSGTIGSSITTLPAQYAPEFQGRFAVPSNGSLGLLLVSTDGTLTPSTGSNADFSLDGVRWRIKP